MFARKSPRRTLGGLELRKELERATLEVLGSISLPGSPAAPIAGPLFGLL